MEGFEPKKLALIRIYQIFKDNSDSEHPITREEIANRLENEYGIIMERKAISRNISLLKEAGVEIASKREGSYLNVRQFEDSELHMLIDGVLSSKYITASHSKDLINRLCGLSNKYFRSSVKHIHSVNDWSKTDNQALFYNIELIDKAIEQCVQIEYDYNKYGVDKKLHKSSHQVISPYLMVLHNQRYYLMGHSDYWKHIVFHHLDRITDMKITNIKSVPIRSIEGYENGINYKELSSAVPYMYTDKPELIEMIADKGIIDQVVDWFGSAVEFYKTDREDKIRVTVKASPNAMVHWAMQYVDYVEVVKPERLRNQIKESLINGVNKYGGN